MIPSKLTAHNFFRTQVNDYAEVILFTFILSHWVLAVFVRIQLDEHREGSFLAFILPHPVHTL